ncbi:MAG TPA: F0F1 ATP synthase subunit delta [Steroidobacteraceae bacterium]|nr:F0F1 ATP synthase subunit delta [Steroidobacteraceae bacterium]
MADRTTIARPYAKAAFADASAARTLGEWSRALAIGAQVVRDPRVARLLDNPEVSPAQLAELVAGIAGPDLTPAARNFVTELAGNHRLGYLPEISSLFEKLKDAYEGVADVTVTSAAPLDAAQQQRLSQALAKRLKREIRLHCETDPRLIGGAVLQAGDLVIDGSLRSKLERMTYELTA